MSLTVYADVLFCVNFSLDYVALYITGRLTSSPSSTARMCASAALGAAFAVCALIFDMKGFLYVAASAAVCFLMCLCAYKKTDVIGCLGAAVLLFSVGAALGGAMTALSALTAGYRDSVEGGGSEDVAVFAVAATASALTAVAARYARRRCFRGTREVTVKDGGISKTLTALADSGCFLREPLSGRSALIVRANALSGVLPSIIVDAASAEDVSASAALLPPEMLGRIRLIPVTGVLGSGLLLGYVPDEIYVVSGKRRRQTDSILALSADKGRFAGCDAIIPGDLI